MQSSQRAFSLMEIIIAVGIIVLFVTLPVLAFSNYSKSSRDQKRKGDVLKVAQALEQYKAEKGTYPVDLDALVSEGYLPEIPKDPKDGQTIDDGSGLTYGYDYSTDGTSYTLSANLENEIPGQEADGNGVFIVNPTNPGGVEGPIAKLTQQAQLSPSPVIATATPFLSPTSGIGTTITPVPCNQTIVCSGSCQALPLRCGTYASTKGSCLYTTRSGTTNCGQVVAPDQPCTFSSGTCAANYTCQSTNCVQNCNSGVSCTGACQQVTNKCAPNAYNSTRNGCTYTTHVNGQSCASVSAPNQVCSITAQSCGGGVPYCQTSTSTCRQCLTNANCAASAPVCNGTTFTCGACITSADCAAHPSQPVCSAGQCIAISALTRMYAFPTAQEDHYEQKVRYLSDGSFVVGMLTQDALNGVIDSIQIVKFNANGTLAWRRKFGNGTFNYNHSINDMIITSDDGIVIAGSVPTGDLSGQNTVGMLIAKYSSTGVLQWRNLYGYGGSNQQTTLTKIVEVPAAMGGGFIASGNSNNILGSNKGAMIAVRFTSAGAFSWMRVMGSAAIAGDSSGHGISVVPSTSKFLLAGTTAQTPLGGNTNHDIVVHRLNSDGSLNGTTHYGTTEHEAITTIDSLADGRLLIAAAINGWSQNLFVRTDLNGDQQAGYSWTGYIGDMTGQPDNSFTITYGSSIAQYNSSQSKIWERSFTNGENCYPQFASVNPGGNRFVAVKCEKNPSVAYYNTLIARTDTAGNINSCSDIGTTNVLPAFTSPPSYSRFSSATTVANLYGGVANYAGQLVDSSPISSLTNRCN